MLHRLAILVFGLLLSTSAFADSWDCSAFVGWSKVGKFLINYPANTNPGNVDWYPTPTVAPTSPLTRGGVATADRITGNFEMDFLATPVGTLWQCQNAGYLRWTCNDLSNTRPENLVLRCQLI